MRISWKWLKPCVLKKRLVLFPSKRLIELIIDLQEISHFEAEDKYVFLVTTEGVKYLTNYTISVLSEKLPAEQFLQINRANIIHKQKIKEIEKHFNGKFQITMKDKAQTKLMSGGTFGEAVKELFI